MKIKKKENNLPSENIKEQNRLTVILPVVCAAVILICLTVSLIVALPHLRPEKSDLIPSDDTETTGQTELPSEQTEGTEEKASSETTDISEPDITEPAVSEESATDEETVPTTDEQESIDESIPETESQETIPGEEPTMDSEPTDPELMPTPQEQESENIF